MYKLFLRHFESCPRTCNIRQIPGWAKSQLHYSHLTGIFFSRVFQQAVMFYSGQADTGPLVQRLMSMLLETPVSMCNLPQCFRNCPAGEIFYVTDDSKSAVHQCSNPRLTLLFASPQYTVYSDYETLMLAADADPPLRLVLWLIHSGGLWVPLSRNRPTGAMLAYFSINQMRSSFSKNFFLAMWNHHRDLRQDPQKRPMSFDPARRPKRWVTIVV